MQLLHFSSPNNALTRSSRHVPSLGTLANPHFLPLLPATFSNPIVMPCANCAALQSGNLRCGNSTFRTKFPSPGNIPKSQLSYTCQKATTMAYRPGATAAAASSSQPALDDKINSKWVNVTWMPHASLSQTSHVCLSIRSAQIVGARCFGPLKLEDWQVRVTVHGIAGLPLISTESLTPMSPVVPSIESIGTKEEARYISNEIEWQPRVSNSTLCCNWDFVVQIPIRWRDLPRDAFLLFEVTGKCDVMVRN